MLLSELFEKLVIDELIVRQGFGKTLASFWLYRLLMGDREYQLLQAG